VLNPAAGTTGYLSAAHIDKNFNYVAYNSEIGKITITSPVSKFIEINAITVDNRQLSATNVEYVFKFYMDATLDEN
jgi:hypothetical protein